MDHLLIRLVFSSQRTSSLPCLALPFHLHFKPELHGLLQIRLILKLTDLFRLRTVFFGGGGGGCLFVFAFVFLFTLRAFSVSEAGAKALQLG